MPNQTLFQKLTVDQVQGSLTDLLREIAFKIGRVEIVDGDGRSDCVLISRQELDGLERALEVLSNTHEVKALCEHIAQFAVIDNQIPVPEELQQATLPG